MSWLIISEILPLRVRSNGVMIGVALNRFAGFLVASTFLRFDQINISWIYVEIIFAGVYVLGIRILYINIFQRLKV